jgi:CBS domain-containing protein
VMAGNAPFRGSLATWLDRVRLWTERARPEDLLNVDITFDMRPVRGDGALAEELRQAALAAARRSRPFLRLLQQAGATGDSPFGLFGRLKAEEGSIDLKRFGLRPLVTAARLLALAHGVAARGTAERLEGVIALEVGGRADLEAALAVRERLLGLILREQLADIAAGRKASNRVPLSLVRQQGGLGALRHDLRHVAALEALTADLVSTDEPDGLQR